MFDLDSEISERTISDYTVRSHDPFGFFKITRTAGGKVPEELSGAYTSLTEVEKAIEAYERTNPPSKEKLKK